VISSGEQPGCGAVLAAATILQLAVGHIGRNPDRDPEIVRWRT
jgi:hypothetical protein